ncbi:hypothetical protein D3C81_1878870 [compost metagenome]
MILIALRSSGRMVLIRVLGWRALRLLTGGLSASWMAVSSTTHTSQVIRKIKPMRLRESLIARPTALLTANSNNDTPQIRPRMSMKAIAMRIRSKAWDRVRKRSL